MQKEKRWIVYVHINKTNAKRYVGITSRSCRQRWGENGERYKTSPYFYNSIQKYGWDNFEHIVLHQNIIEKEAKNLERYYIKKWKTNIKEYGYNCTEGGDGVLGCTVHRGKLVSNNISDDLVPIVEVDASYNVIAEWEVLNDCARENGVQATNISKCARGKHKTCNGRVFMYKKDVVNKTPQQIKEFRDMQRCELGYNIEKISTLKKKVALINKNLEILHIFNSINQASKELKVDASSITKVCKGRIKQTNGYRFIYI